MKEAKSKFPFKDAVRSIPEDKYFSFEGLDEYAEHLAGAFIDMGFKKESRLAVLMGNTAENVRHSIRTLAYFMIFYLSTHRNCQWVWCRLSLNWQLQKPGLQLLPLIQALLNQKI